ncbi:DUF930 domain-containing protein [Ensifer sp. NPDC090286]|uniref:DUF930 domain-containing protein n=1 Tax=Ensifer sp. NPDC090286 TaxID=3363991 RepID=UPI00383A3DD2
MQAVTHRRNETPIWPSLTLALILHAFAALALFLLPSTRPPVPIPDEGIAVQILELPPPRPEVVQPVLGSQNAVAHSVGETAPATERATPPQAAQPMVQAKRFFSAAILADSRSRQALEGLSQLAADERIVQLCNLEAMEQVHRWRVDFNPDLLVAYATSNIRLTGRDLRADGAAFRSRGRWFNIKFGCAVAPDIKSVVRFDFQVGDEIPKSEWEAHFLPSGAEAH